MGMQLSMWAALVFGVAGLVACARRQLARRHEKRSRDEAVRLSCPRSGSDVSCILRRDPVTGRWTSVRYCSGWTQQKDCERTCLHILDLGIPLTPSRRERSEVKGE